MVQNYILFGWKGGEKHCGPLGLLACPPASSSSRHCLVASSPPCLPNCLLVPSCSATARLIAAAWFSPHSFACPPNCSVACPSPHLFLEHSTGLYCLPVVAAGPPWRELGGGAVEMEVRTSPSMTVKTHTPSQTFWLWGKPILLLDYSGSGTSPSAKISQLGIVHLPPRVFTKASAAKSLEATSLAPC